MQHEQVSRPIPIMKGAGKVEAALAVASRYGESVWVYVVVGVVDWWVGWVVGVRWLSVGGLSQAGLRFVHNHRVNRLFHGRTGYIRYACLSL